MADWQAAQGKNISFKKLLLLLAVVACLLAVYGKIIPRELNFFIYLFLLLLCAALSYINILLLLFCYLIMMRAASGRKNKKIQQAKDKNRRKIKGIKEEKLNYISVGWKWRRTMECLFCCVYLLGKIPKYFWQQKCL